MITKEEKDFIGKLSDSDLDNLIGELCIARDNNPDVKLMDNIKNRTIDPILQEQLDIIKDASIIEEDIVTGLFKSNEPLSQEEINMLKAKNLYDKYINYSNQVQGEDAITSIEEEIRRNLASEDIITEVISEEMITEDSFPEETELSTEFDNSDKNNDIIITEEDNTKNNKVNGGLTIMENNTLKTAMTFPNNALKTAMAFPNFVADIALDGKPYMEESLTDIVEELNETIETVTSSETIVNEIKKNESSVVEEDDHEMTIEEFNDVPATNLTVDNNILTSVLTETYDNVSTEDAMKLIEVMNRYKSGEKFDVFEALPNSLKAVINAEAASVGADKATINFFAKTFINDLVNNTYIDKEIKDFNEELKEVLAPMNNIAGTVMDEYSDEVYHKFTDKLEDKANEIETENPEKAAQLREVSKSFTEAINLKRIKDILKENPSYTNKSYKTARDNWNKFCNEYKSKVSNVNPTPRDIDYYLIGLNSSLKSEYSEDIIKALIIMVANSVIKAIEKNTLTEHIYAYYASNSMYTIAFTANNSEVNKIILDNTRKVLDIINDYMKPLLARNSKKNRKRNKKK